MKSITIKGSIRKELGKSSSKKLRNEGKVPCILYGDGEPIHFYSNEIDFKKLVYTPDAHTVNIELDEKNQFNAIMQDIQFHPLTDRIIHIDFYQLSEDKEVSIDIPVRLEGQAPGVLNSGGMLARNKRKLKVRALPKNLPDSILVDISNLELGDKIYTSNLKNDHYTFLHSDSTVVTQVITSRASMILEEPETEETEETEETSETSETSQTGDGDKKAEDGNKEGEKKEDEKKEGDSKD
tara:strand:- start:7506 stop:8222 length:717 start_codon:yes stop_codon:yes gene_type:complete